MRKRKPMLSQPRTARKTASNSWRRSELGKARIRITMGLTLRRTARRIKRLNGARMLILSGYAAQPHSQTPDFLALSYCTRNERGEADLDLFAQTFQQGSFVQSARAASVRYLKDTSDRKCRR